MVRKTSLIAIVLALVACKKDKKKDEPKVVDPGSGSTMTGSGSG
jgi:hypothetical protein